LGNRNGNLWYRRGSCRYDKFSAASGKPQRLAQRMVHEVLEPSPLLIFQPVVKTDELHKLREDVLPPSKGVGIRM
jgi:hypothetical protein